MGSGKWEVGSGKWELGLAKGRKRNIFCDGVFVSDRGGDFCRVGRGVELIWDREFV